MFMKKTPRNPVDVIILSGIANERIKTLRIIEMLLHDFPTMLYIVPDDFPIQQEGILGADFLKHATCINFKNKH